ILMDIQLPGMDGLTLTRRLKADTTTADIPIVGLSAHAMKRDIEMARQAGCVDYITKPITDDPFTFLGRIAHSLPSGVRGQGAEVRIPILMGSVRIGILTYTPGLLRGWL